MVHRKVVQALSPDGLSTNHGVSLNALTTTEAKMLFIYTGNRKYL